MWIELDIYSGKKNPRWQLSKDQVENLLFATAALKSVNRKAPIGRLGYHGLTARGFGENEPKSIYVYGGVAEVWWGNDLKFCEDSGNRVERFLLDTGRDAIEPDLFWALLRNIGNRGTVAAQLRQERQDRRDKQTYYEPPQREINYIP